MKCAKCGAELKEGHLYCEACGEDVHIVPDFEPEIEYSIHKTLEGIIKDVAQEETDAAREREKAESAQEPEKPGKPGKPARAGGRFRTEKRHNKYLILLCCILVCIILIAAAAGGIKRYRYNSLDYQLKQAYACIGREETAEAAAYYERAVELSGQDASLRMELAELYRNLGENEKYIEQLGIVAESSYASEEQVERAYNKIISAYDAERRYEEINQLLETCRDVNVINANQGYMAKMPEFSYQEGTYAEVVPLKLSSNASGNIYYTMDGSEPDESSEVYTTPIFLETGDYVISAVFVNEYGIRSDVARKSYHIDVIRPAAPEVQVYSGEYDRPVMIRVEVPEGCKVYYSTDGSVPTDQSARYYGAIPMPLGKSEFRFIMYNEENVSGDVTTREYELFLNTDLTADAACQNVAQAQLERGKLLDLSGSIPDMEGLYQYDFQYALTIKEQGDFYIIAEIYQDTAGVRTKTGTSYAVDIYSGAAYKMVTDARGNYLLETF